MAARRVSTARQPLRSGFPLKQSLGNQIRVTSRLYDRAIASRLKAFDIPYGAWGFLRQLWQKDGQTQLELASALDLSASTVVFGIDRMEKMDLILRERSSTDRRNVHIQLTKKGKALEAQLLPVAVEVNEIAVSDISKQDLELFSQVLDRIQTVLRNDERQFTRVSHKKSLRRKLSNLD